MSILNVAQIQLPKRISKSWLGSDLSIPYAKVDAVTRDADKKMWFRCPRESMLSTRLWMNSDYLFLSSIRFETVHQSTFWLLKLERTNEPFQKLTSTWQIYCKVVALDYELPLHCPYLLRDKVWSHNDHSHFYEIEITKPNTESKLNGHSRQRGPPEEWIDIPTGRRRLRPSVKDHQLFWRSFQDQDHSACGSSWSDMESELESPFSQQTLMKLAQDEFLFRRAERRWATPLESLFQLNSVNLLSFPILFPVVTAQNCKQIPNPQAKHIKLTNWCGRNIAEATEWHLRQMGG